MKKFLTITHRGIEDIAALEIKEILGVGSVIIDSGVLFEAEETNQFCYQAQSVRWVIELKDRIDFKELEDMKKLNFDFSDLEGKRFALRMVNKGKFATKELERTIGGAIKEKSGAIVDLDEPEVQVLGFLAKNKLYIGYDQTGFDLSKREYNIFSIQRSVKGDIAYALSRIAGWTPKKTLLDPYCGSGGVVIEAGLFGIKKSPHFYNKDRFKEVKDKVNDVKLSIFACDEILGHINSSKKNAKIAGVDMIEFSRQDIEFLKYKDIDCIVSYLPNINPKKIGLILRSMKDTGKTVFLTHQELPLEKNREIWQGKEKLFVYTKGL